MTDVPRDVDLGSVVNLPDFEALATERMTPAA